MSTTVIKPVATGEPGYSSNFACNPESVRGARGLIQSALQTWGMGHIVPEALVAVSELAGNAVVHSGGTEIKVCVQRAGPSRIRIEVTDSSKVLPRLECPRPTDESGRGLALVDILADRWGAEDFAGGKRVWAEISSAASTE